MSISLPSRTINWLLQPEDPTTRYFSLRDLLDRPETASDMKQAKQAIMGTGPVPKILAKQKKGGYWGIKEDFYIRAKYKGTVWNMILLAELGADGRDPRVRETCEFVLRWSQDRKSGGFAYRGSSNGGNHSGVIPCLTGNMAWCLVRFGHLKDPRVQKALDWIVSYMRFDDGSGRPPRAWPYDHWEDCWDRHTCHMGIVKALKALAAIPPAERTEQQKDVLKKGCEYLLRHHIHKRSHDLGRVSKPGWLKLGYPRMWDTDIIEILDILTSLGYRDPRMREAVDVVYSKQDESGRWALEHTWNDRFLVSIEKKGKPSKGLTLRALRVLRRWSAPCPQAKL
jgi:hypothetical protein